MTLLRKPMFAAILCSGAFLAAAATAEAHKGVNKGQNPNSPMIAQLRSTIGVLKQADHDYQGHRVKAIQQIHLALKALAPGKHAHAKLPSGNGKLPQDVSDGLLKKAIQQLNTVQAALANSTGPGNRPAAVTAIQNAITELQTALKIR
jgi:hypothetical protein